MTRYPSMKQLAFLFEEVPHHHTWLDAALRASPVRSALVRLDDISYTLGWMLPSRALEELTAAKQECLQLLRSSSSLTVPNHPEGVAALLIQEAETLLRCNPAKAVKAMNLACQVAHHLVAISSSPVRMKPGPDPGSGRLVEVDNDDDLCRAQLIRARCRAWLAHCLGAIGEFETAELRLAQAHADLDACEDLADRRPHAELLMLEAALRDRQQRHSEAEALLTQARELYEALGDDHMVGRTLLTQGRIGCRLSLYPIALPRLQRALQLLDQLRDERAIEVCLQALVSGLLQQNQLEEAERLASDTPFPTTTLAYAYRLWTSATLHKARGEMEPARTTFASAQKLLHKSDQLLPALLAALDLIETACKSDLEHPILHRTVDQALTPFEVPGLSQELIRAVCTLRLAASDPDTLEQKVRQVRDQVQMLLCL